jgi:hypothetical protein
MFDLTLTHQGQRQSTTIASGFPSLRSAWLHALDYLRPYTLVGCRLIDCPISPSANFTAHCPDGTVDFYEITRS